MKADADWPDCSQCKTNVLVAKVRSDPDLDWQCFGCGIRWSV